MLNYLFLSGPSPTCLDAADSNDDGDIEISDAINTANHIFVQGPPLPEPGIGECGIDPTVDMLLDCAYPLALCE